MKNKSFINNAITAVVAMSSTQRTLGFTGFPRTIPPIISTRLDARKPVDDVTIAGAGPAGIYAAEFLANNGYKVTMIDNRINVGGDTFVREDKEVGFYPGAIFSACNPFVNDANTRIYDDIHKVAEQAGGEDRVPLKYLGEIASDGKRVPKSENASVKLMLEAGKFIIDASFRYKKGQMPWEDYTKEIKEFSKGPGQLFMQTCGYIPPAESILTQSDDPSYHPNKPVNMQAVRDSYASNMMLLSAAVMHMDYLVDFNKTIGERNTKKLLDNFGIITRKAGYQEGLIEKVKILQEQGVTIISDAKVTKVKEDGSYKYEKKGEIFTGTSDAFISTMKPNKDDIKRIFPTPTGNAQKALDHIISWAYASVKLASDELPDICKDLSDDEIALALVNSDKDTAINQPMAISIYPKKQKGKYIGTSWVYLDKNFNNSSAEVAELYKTVEENLSKIKGYENMKVVDHNFLKDYSPFLPKSISPKNNLPLEINHDTSVPIYFTIEAGNIPYVASQANVGIKTAEKLIEDDKKYRQLLLEQ